MKNCDLLWAVVATIPVSVSSSHFATLPREAKVNRWNSVLRGSHRGVAGDRFLQTENQCVNNSTVNFAGDEFLQSVYGSAYQGTCTCTQEQLDNTDELTALIKSAPNLIAATPDEIAAFEDEFNNAFGGVEGGYEYSCTSGCATCFPDDLCGTMSVSELSKVKGQPTNFTFDQISSGLADVDPALLQPSFNVTFTTDTCIDYVSGESGKLCLGISYSGPSDNLESALAKCVIKYNDVACNSCASSRSGDDDSACFKADCTNIDPDASLDSCSQTGFVGPFRFLPFWTEIENTTVTLGTCTGGSPTGNETTTEPPEVGTDPPMTNDTSSETLSPTVSPTPASVETAPPSVSTGTGNTTMAPSVPAGDDNNATSAPMENATESTPFPTPTKGAVSDAAPPTTLASSKAPGGMAAAPSGNVRSNGSPKNSGRRSITMTVAAALLSTVVFSVFW
jgi:hypothetical protein